MAKRDEQGIQSRMGLVPVFIEATDLSNAWFQVIWKIMEKGYRYQNQRGSFEGIDRVELDYAFIQVRFPSEEILVPIIPENLNIPAPTTLEYVTQDYFPRYLMSSEKAEGEQYTYGERINMPVNDLITGKTKTQLEWVIGMLKKTPETNQAIIAIERPEDVAEKDGKGHPDPPCLRFIDFRVRYGKLHTILYFRSWDAWGGFPANLGGLHLLQKYVAMEVGIPTGEIMASSKGLHVYKHAEDVAKILTHMEESK